MPPAIPQTSESRAAGESRTTSVVRESQNPARVEFELSKFNLPVKDGVKQEIEIPDLPFNFVIAKPVSRHQVSLV